MIFCFLLLLFVCVSCQPVSPVIAKMENECRWNLSVERSTSPWRDYTGSRQEEEASRHIRAEELKSEYAPLSILGPFENGFRLLAKDLSGRRIVANRNYFSDLQRPDAVSASQGTRVLIGTYHNLPFDVSLLPEFLLVSHLISTCVHIESHLCVKDGIEDGSIIRIPVKGYHVYFTNRRNEAPLSFEIEIKRKNGAMYFVQK